MTEPTSTPEPRSAGSLVRDVAVIVLAGIALGIAHNAYLLGSGPRAGLAWIKQEERPLAKLEDVLGAGTEAAPVTTAAPATGSPATAARGGDGAEGPAADAAAKPAATGTGAAVPREKPVTPATGKSAAPAGDPAAATAAPPPSSSAPAPTATAPATTPPPPADVPEIPPTREPLEAGLAVVRRLHAANAAVFVDARTAGEYAEGHIPGAVHLSFDDVFKDPELAKKLDDRGLPIVAYCGGGDCDLSRNLAFSLIDAGKKRVLVFLDGTAGWAAAGLPMTKGPQP